MKYKNIEIMDIKEGQTFKLKIPFGEKPMKVHICYILPSKCYSDRTLIIYRVYGKHKQWWHEFMCTLRDFEFYQEMTKKYNERGY